MIRAVCIGECMVELRPAGDGLLGQAFAGDVYNVAVYLKRSAPEVDVQFASVTGTDPFSQAMHQAWRREGVGDDLAACDPERRPGLYLIDTDAGGERRFHYWRAGSAACGWARAMAQAAQAGRLDGADLVYLSGISLAILTPDDRALALRLLAELRGRVGLIAFDPNFRPALWSGPGAARQAFEAMAGLADILLPSREDLEMLYGEGDIDALAARLVGLGATEFALTAGAERCLVHAGGRSERLPPPIVQAAVDTSGAGDSFNGAYLAARLSGASAFDAARAGMALAAHVVLHPGAIAAPLQPDGAVPDA